VRDAEIARRLRVNQSTVLRHLGPAGAQGQLLLQRDAAEPAPGMPRPPQPVPEAEPGREGTPEPGPAADAGRGAGGHGGGGSGDGAAAAGPGITGQVVSVCGSDAAARLRRPGRGRADPGRRGGQAAGVALLSAVSSCFALGEATLEQFKHLAAADAGPLAGLGALPDLRTIRPELADRTDPVAVQRLFASAMLAADPVLSGVYYVDDHFVPYAGAKPVAKGWNNKRGKAERGRADTLLAGHDGRAVCFVAGEPSGLAATLPKALAELTKAAGPGAQIMVGFDRGGAYAQVFRHCRDQQAHWVIYRRAPLAVPAMLPVITTITVGGKARQVTLFEHGAVALQILTSDLDACPADILAWLKSR
jgi:hypothetical protein